MIRFIRPEDTEIVAKLADRAWAPIFQGFIDQIGDEMMRLTRPDYKTCKSEWVREAVKTMPDRMLVCERDGKIAGFISFSMNEQTKVGNIGNNAVDPDFQGQGVAQEQYAAVFEIFKKNGMKVAQVNTGLDDAHAPARRAYERAGFKEHLPNVTYYKKLD